VRRQDLESTFFGRIFGYDESGIMTYKHYDQTKDEEKARMIKVTTRNRENATVWNSEKSLLDGLEFLAEINRTDDYGRAIYSAEEQLGLINEALGGSRDIKDIITEGKK